MASNLSCIGLGVAGQDELERLVADEVVPRATLVGRRDDVEVWRWDDASGARLTLVVREDRIDEILPSLAAPAEARLGPLAQWGDGTHLTSLDDDEGDAWAAVTVELEQGGLLPHGHPGGTGALVALGRDVTVFDDTAAYEASGESGQVGWLISPSVFGHGAPSASAALTAEVIDSERRVNTVTNQRFVVARVHVAEVAVAHLCLDGGGFPEALRPGQVVHGEVFLVASLAAEGAGAGRARRWSPFGRRRR